VLQSPIGILMGDVLGNILFNALLCDANIFL
jgi:hypothetical protein